MINGLFFATCIKKKKNNFKKIFETKLIFKVGLVKVILYAFG